MVGHEEGVELAPLECLRQTGEALEIEVRIRPRARITPCRGVDADGPHESAEAQLTRAVHSLPPRRRDRSGLLRASLRRLQMISCRKSERESNRRIRPVGRIWRHLTESIESLEVTDWRIQPT